MDWYESGMGEAPRRAVVGRASGGVEYLAVVVE